MKKVKLLVVGYSKFVEKRLFKSLKKIKKIDFRICSKTKINDKIYYNNYLNGLQFKPNLIYISLTNHLHYKFAKLFLKKGYNVVVDKPITESLIKTTELIKIAKSKNLLLSEATLFNYHAVFQQIIKMIGGKKKIEFLQSNFNIPQVKLLKEINLTKSDCFMDMSPYAAALIRLYLDNNNLSINFDYKKFSNNKNIKSFYVLANDKKIRYFGNFSFDNEYLSQIVFFSKKK
jgi:predicted dehydrogenase